MTILLDASALLALLHDEQGADIVDGQILDAALLAVNLEEVVGILAKQGMPGSSIERALAPLALPILPFTEEMAWLAGKLRPLLPSGLGIADRSCLAAAGTLKLGVLTADSLWRQAAPVFNVKVQLIR